MFEVNVPKLVGKIAERGFNKTSFAKVVGIDRNTLNAYIKSPEKMPYDVINRMAYALETDYPESETIFFARKLS